jgi:hypothetical protein
VDCLRGYIGGPIMTDHDLETLRGLLWDAVPIVLLALLLIL